MYVIQVTPGVDETDDQMFQVEAFKADEHADVSTMDTKEGDERELHADLTWLSSSTGVLHAALANVSESIYVDHKTTKEANATGEVQQETEGTEEGATEESQEAPEGNGDESGQEV